MHKHIKHTLLFLLTCLIIGLGYLFYASVGQHSYEIRITNLDQPQTFTIPLRCEGWAENGAILVENNANDTLLLGGKYFAPGETGRILTMEGYDLYLKEPWITSYQPYKATSGSIVIEYFLVPW